MATPNIQMVGHDIIEINYVYGVRKPYAFTPLGLDDDPVVDTDYMAMTRPIMDVFVVRNPAWNKRLTNSDSHAAFKTLMEAELEVDRVQSITKGLKSDRFYFETLTF